MLYEKNLLDKWTAYSVLKTAEEKGMEKGMEKGIEKGMEKGAEQKSAEFIKNLLASGKFTISEIASYVGVSEDFVRKVKKRSN